MWRAGPPDAPSVGPVPRRHGAGLPGTGAAADGPGDTYGAQKLGTTLRGIGPAYEDKAGRRGIRVADATDSELLRSRIERNIEDANLIIRRYRRTTLDAEQVFKRLLGEEESRGRIGHVAIDDRRALASAQSGAHEFARRV